MRIHSLAMDEVVMKIFGRKKYKKSVACELCAQLHAYVRPQINGNSFLAPCIIL
ncbi:MAG TPA: hypothetical protein VE978_23100 [Chitinophagales bacterium]|nr:hypothetical protein [Chitinophagales bacterium]